LKTLQVMRSMGQFLSRGRVRNGFLNQFLVEARPWEFLLSRKCQLVPIFEERATPLLGFGNGED
jgi:hypothetical protein